MLLNQKIDLIKLVIIIVFLSFFVLPINLFRQIGFNFDEYIFAFAIIVYFFNYIFKNGKLKLKDFFILIIMIYFFVIDSTLTHIHFLSLIVLDKMLVNKEKIAGYIYNSRITMISLLFVFVYSVIYFGHDGRYIYTGLRSPNQGGLTLILLFLIIRIKNKKMGNLMLLMGLLTFSKSYLLGLLIFIITNILVHKKIPSSKLLIASLKNFKFLAISSVVFVILVSGYFGVLYNTNSLKSYTKGFERYTTIFDYSNYFRFSVNTNLLKVYEKHPDKLLYGIDNEDFFLYNLEITQDEGQRYNRIKPHNYFFSYMQKYGIFSLMIFWYLASILKKVVVRENLSVFLLIFAYVTFLGSGLTSNWLYLSVFTMLLYSKALSSKEKLT